MQISDVFQTCDCFRTIFLPPIYQILFKFNSVITFRIIQSSFRFRAKPIGEDENDILFYFFTFRKDTTLVNLECQAKTRKEFNWERQRSNISQKGRKLVFRHSSLQESLSPLFFRCFVSQMDNSPPSLPLKNKLVWPRGTASEHANSISVHFSASSTRDAIESSSPCLPYLRQREGIWNLELTSLVPFFDRFLSSLGV